MQPGNLGLGQGCTLKVRPSPFSDLHTSNALNAEQFSDSANKREMAPAPKSFVYKMVSIVEMSAEALPARTKLKRMTTKDRGRFVQGTNVKLSSCTHKESGMVTYVSIWPLFVACKPVCHMTDCCSGSRRRDIQGAHSLTQTTAPAVVKLIALLPWRPHQKKSAHNITDAMPLCGFPVKADADNSWTFGWCKKGNMQEPCKIALNWGVRVVGMHPRE